MKKTERILYLLVRLKKQSSMQINEMADECGVSHRTIYRDLKSLINMDIPICFDSGYRLQKDTNLPVKEFTSDDIRLINLILKTNWLNKYSFFAERLRLIEGKLTGNHNSSDNQSLVEGSFTTWMEIPKAFHQHLAAFLEAIFTQKQVRIKTVDKIYQRCPLKPIAVNLQDEKSCIQAKVPGIKQLVEIPLSKVAKILLL